MYVVVQVYSIICIVEDSLLVDRLLTIFDCTLDLLSGKM